MLHAHVTLSAFAAALGLVAVASARAQPSSMEQLLSQTDSLWNAGNRERSTVLLDSLLAGSEPAGSPQDRLQMLLRAGSRRISLGQPVQSEAASREAVSLAVSLGDSSAVRASLRWLSVAVSSQGRAAEARALCLRLLASAVASGDRHHEGWALVGLGWNDFNAGNSREAERNFERAAELFAGLTELDGVAWSRNASGTARSRLGDYDQARQSYAEAARTARETGFGMVEAMALNNLATLELSLGDPGVALEQFMRAVELQRRRGSRREGIVPALNIAICQIDLGRYEDAEENLSEQLAECRASGYKDLEGDVLYMSSEVQRARGELHAAAATLRQALGLGESLNLRTRVECLIGLSDLLAAMDSSLAAFEVIESSSRALRDRSVGEIGIRLLLARADRLLALARPQEALESLEQVLASQGIVPRDALRIEALVLAAQAHREDGNSARARAMLAEAAGLWERERGAPLDPEWREQRGRTGERLYSSIASLLLADAGPKPGAEVIGEVFDRLQRFKARTLQERMRGPAAAAAADSVLAAVRLDELQARLAEDDLFLDLYLGRANPVMIAVAAHERRIVRLPATDELDRMIHDLLDLVSVAPSARTDDREAVHRVAQRTYARIFGEIEDLIDQSRRIVIAPDGILTMAPYRYMFFARMMESGATGPDAKEWVRVPSARVWLDLKGRPSPTGRPPRILAVAGRESAGGAPLPGTLAEVRSLSRRYRGVRATTPRPGSALAPQHLAGHEVLHFASHFELDDQHPWQSRFYFAAGDSSAPLRAADIARERIDARLVFLATCGSAGGRIVSGEGVLGVSSAFVSAGSASIVATLWPVDDRVTAGLVERFYAELEQGATVGAALGRAQEAVAREPATAHPFYWAGFVLIGDPGTRVALETRGPLAAWTIAAGIALAAAIVAIPLLRRGRRNAYSNTAIRRVSRVTDVRSRQK